MILKKFFWAIIIILATLCAYTAADLVTIRMKTLWDIPPRLHSFNTVEEKKSDGKQNLKEYYQIIESRDIFQLANPDKVAGGGEEKEEKTAPLTDLKLKLLGTIAGKDIIAYAIIKDLGTKKQDIYKEGDDIGPAQVARIYRNKVIIRRDGAEEMLIAFENLEPVQEGEEPTEEARFIPRPEAVEQSAKGIPAQIGQKVAPNHWVLQRKEVEESIGNANQLLTQVRIVPHFQDGKMDQPDGFQVANIKSMSFFERMGLKSGDIIKSVNGQIVDNPEKAFEAYQRLKNEPHIQVTIMRANKEINLNYDINQ